jgi:hypothetical protein
MDDIPAWLLCQDICARAQEELTSQAIETLDREIEAKRLKIDGHLVTADEGTNEIEKKLFVIGKIVDGEQEIYNNYMGMISKLENSENELTGKLVERIEELKRFLLAVSTISILMRYSKLFRNWFEDIGHHFKENSAENILFKTMNPSRLEALEFITKNKRIIFENLFSENELNIMMNAAVKFKNIKN